MLYWTHHNWKYEWSGGLKFEIREQWLAHKSPAFDAQFSILDQIFVCVRVSMVPSIYFNLVGTVSAYHWCSLTSITVLSCFTTYYLLTLCTHFIRSPQQFFILIMISTITYNNALFCLTRISVMILRLVSDSDYRITREARYGMFCEKQGGAMWRTHTGQQIRYDMKGSPAPNLGNTMWLVRCCDKVPKFDNAKNFLWVIRYSCFFPQMIRY